MNIQTSATRPLASAIPVTSVYDSDRWALVVRDGFGLGTHYLHIDDSVGDVACVPVMTRRQGPFRLVGSPLRGTHTEFGGAFAVGVDQAEILQQLHRQLRAARNSWIEWIFAPSVLDHAGQDALCSLGYVTEHKHSIMVDLNRPLDDIWAGFAGRARTEVRKAEKNGLQIVRLGPDNCASYMQLVADVFARQQRNASFDQRFLDAVHAHLLPEEFAHYGVFKDTQLVAGGLFLTGVNRMVFVSGASDHESRKLGVNSLIQWQAIQDAVAAGVTQYDMGGTGVGAIDKFKASFGGVPICYDRYVYKTMAARVPAALYQFAHSRGWV